MFGISLLGGKEARLAFHEVRYLRVSDSFKHQNSVIFAESRVSSS